MAPLITQHHSGPWKEAVQGQPKQPTSVSSSLEMKNSPNYKESSKAWMQLERETGVWPSRAFVYGLSREHAMYPEKFWQAGKMDTGLGGSYGHSDKRGWQQCGWRGTDRSEGTVWKVEATELGTELDPPRVPCTPFVTLSTINRFVLI